MILIDNINYLRDKYPIVWEELKKLEDKENELLDIEDTRKGDKTILLKKDDKKIYLHSKYNPIREAETIVEQYKNLDKNTNVIFYGTGLGYQIDLFIKMNPNNKFYIFEPIPELLQAFLSIRNLKSSNYNNLMGISLGLEGISGDISKFIELNRNETIIMYLPSHKQNFEGEYKRFSEVFLNTVRSTRGSIVTNYEFQRRWIINSMKNFKEVLRTPNILMGKRDKFKDRPAILVAAGPSLNEEIENIRYIKKNGLAYIFSVGSAINTLIRHDIYPDVVTTYDPMERTDDNQRVFEKVIKKDITQIPMIFGSSVGHRTQSEYPGEKYHMITSQDKVANYYLESNEDIKIDIVLDASSIAVVTLQLLSNLGFSPIILVGQNLGYLGTKHYSEGIEYEEALFKEQLKQSLYTEDVYGNQIQTNLGFENMRSQMELYIHNLETGRVINTTKGGAKIEGAEFRELENIIANDMEEKIVIENWLGRNKTNYDKQELNNKVGLMDMALNEAYLWINEYNESLNKIYDLVRNRNFKQLDPMYNKLDVSIVALESNSFFTTFILQMNRVEHKLLADAVKISKLEKNIYKRHIDLLNSYKVFIDKCVEDIGLLKPIYEEMKKDINKYINCDNESGGSNV